MKNFWTRWAVLLIAIIFLSSCGASNSSPSATPLTPEGTVADPSPLTNLNLATTNPGQVGNTTSGSKSYYRATVASGTTYTITLYGLSADADLWVYYDRPFDFIAGPVCKSQNGGTSNEQCVVTTSTTTTMNIEVDGQYSLSGATYSISVNSPQPVGSVLGDFDFDAFDNGDTSVWYTDTGFVSSGTGPLWSIDCTISPINGTCSIYSTGLPTSETSCVSYTTTTATDSYVSFDLKVTSRQYYDLLLFYIDNVLQLPVWSGTVAPEKVMFNTTTGTHAYKWCHTNNDTAIDGKVWVDNIYIQ